MSEQDDAGSALALPPPPPDGAPLVVPPAFPPPPPPPPHPAATSASAATLPANAPRNSRLLTVPPPSPESVRSVRASIGLRAAVMQPPTRTASRSRSEATLGSRRRGGTARRPGP